MIQSQIVHLSHIMKVILYICELVYGIKIEFKQACLLLPRFHKE